MSKSTRKIEATDASALRRGVRRALVDSVDEELEMEIDDGFAKDLSPAFTF